MSEQEFELTTKLRIRPVDAEDAKDLHAYCFTSRDAEEVADELKSDLARIKKNEVYRVVAEASGHAIGNIRMEHSKGDNEIGEISQLAVSTPFRTFGVADKLIDVTSQIAQENGIKTLQIELPESDGAIIEAYKRWGFAERPVVVLQRVVGAPEVEAPEAEAPEVEAPKEEAPEEKAPAKEAPASSSRGSSSRSRTQSKKSDDAGEQQELL